MAKKTYPKIGRSLLAGETTVAEIAKLTKPFTTAKHYIREEMTSYVYDSVIVEGDLVIDGDFDTFDRGLSRIVITGSLRVSGLYRDCDDPETAVFVLGDLEAGRAITNGALCIGGNLIVRETLVGYYNDNSAEIHGSVIASVFVPENHHFGIDGALDVDYVIGSGAEWRVSSKLKKAAMPTADATLKAVIVPEIARGGISTYPEDELDIDQSVIRTRVSQGLPILREGAPVGMNTAKPAKAKARAAAKKPAAKPAKKSAAKKPAPKKPARKKPAPKKKSAK